VQIKFSFKLLSKKGPFCNLRQSFVSDRQSDIKTRTHIQFVDTITHHITSSPGFGSWPIHVDFVVKNIVALGQVYLLVILINNQLGANFFYIYLFRFSTCFEKPCAHHQESQLYQYDIWYMSLCVGDRPVYRSGGTRPVYRTVTYTE